MLLSLTILERNCIRIFMQNWSIRVDLKWTYLGTYLLQVETAITFTFWHLKLNYLRFLKLSHQDASNLKSIQTCVLWGHSIKQQKYMNSKICKSKSFFSPNDTLEIKKLSTLCWQKSNLVKSYRIIQIIMFLISSVRKLENWLLYTHLFTTSIYSVHSKIGKFIDQYDSVIYKCLFAICICYCKHFWGVWNTLTSLWGTKLVLHRLMPIYVTFNHA